MFRNVQRKMILFYWISGWLINQLVFPIRAFSPHISSDACKCGLCRQNNWTVSYEFRFISRWLLATFHWIITLKQLWKCLSKRHKQSKNIHGYLWPIFWKFIHMILSEFNKRQICHSFSFSILTNIFSYQYIFAWLNDSNSTGLLHVVMLMCIQFRHQR